ncbi:MAG: undecaprenyldiphospho-muramoylpentapeptide beta-N-acetylglucosaminyltransferase [Bacilli bacterium]|jgi:UDP-N-acetylglucosamine--N-acetylmuramyl-(pentapeptide) pyrophosphoryl-undecaprenol N-acetylglucosamine transferase|nr:undecaprenyldiphospho-muramoylpentapeptide beta-N-acetylglucosaminyltransferase [Bacilli bacterium]
MRIIISAGGTGGHIYPAIAIINKIKEKEPDSEFLFIGTHNRMEKDIIPNYGIKYVPLTIIGFKRKLTLKNIKTLSYFFKAIKEAKQIIKEFDPDIVIGFGGYISGPVLYAAMKLGYPTLIHEQNSILGLANRFLIRYVDKMAISFPEMLNYVPNEKKVVFTGNPCSEYALEAPKMDKTKLGLTKNKKLVVIVMGSLGSTAINTKMQKMLQLFNNKEYEVLFITGKEYYDDFKDLKLASNIKIVSYVDEFNSLMKVTDLMVSRAGATTISQIIALNIPTIFIPSPYVVNDHQLKNALELVNREAALLIEEKDLKGDIIVRQVDAILQNKDKYDNIKNNLNRLIIKESATKIYDLARNLIDGSK